MTNDLFHIELLTASDLDKVVSLQIENLKSNISTDVASSQGFLTFQYSEDFIKEMMTDMAQPIAKDNNGEVIGYAFASSLNSCKNNELLKPIVDLSKTFTIHSQPLTKFNYYIMGQICVKDGYRNLGIFDALYNKHKELFSGFYDYIITEISVHNKRSLAAHQRVGFEIINQYTQDDTVWNVVAWNWNK